MRFEDLTHENKIRFLYYLHKKINEDLFNNTLSEDIDIRTSLGSKPCFAQFHGEFPCFDENDNVNLKECIVIDIDFCIYLEQLKQRQRHELYRVMLHEMIHQYCYENGIEDDGSHNQTWQKIAEKHGLFSTYCDGEQIEEFLLPLAEHKASNIRIK